MKLIECTSCKCTATIEDADTLPGGWCEVDIPNKTVASFTGVLCEECKMKLMTRIIEKVLMYQLLILEIMAELK